MVVSYEEWGFLILVALILTVLVTYGSVKIFLGGFRCANCQGWFTGRHTRNSEEKQDMGIKYKYRHYQCWACKHEWKELSISQLFGPG